MEKRHIDGLVADALLLEFDTTKKHGAEAYVNSSLRQMRKR